MLSKDELRVLICEENEGETVDFKAESYDLSNPGKKADFIKDVLAMANTPRDRPAYIVTGVKHYSDGSRDLLGIDQHPDDADLQPVLNNARVDPKPDFIYQPYQLDGKSYGIIEIYVKRPGRPFIAQVDFGGSIKAHRVYYRRGTTNDEASGETLNRILEWLRIKAEVLSTPPPIEPPRIPRWNEFHNACHHFDPFRHYLFIIGNEGRNELGSKWRFFARLPITVVLDFDPGTETAGAYSQVQPVLSKRRSLHLWTIGNGSSLVPDRASYWFAARGLAGRESSLVDEYREWNRLYRRPLGDFIESFARASEGRPLTVISLWFGLEYIRAVCDQVDQWFADRADYVFAGKEAERLADLAKLYSGQSIEITLGEILDGIEYKFPADNTSELQIAGVPSASGTFFALEPDRLNWLREDLEVLHSNIELDSEDNTRQVGIDYLRGAGITWKDIELHYDADRDDLPKIKELVETELKNRSAIQINLYHWPGAGGTTLASRIAWDLHRNYPVVQLRRYVKGETVSRFRYLSANTELPILAVVEGADITSDVLEKLFGELSIENVSIVFLSVVRRHNHGYHGVPRTHRSYFLDSQLTNRESYRFVETFSRALPSKRPALERIQTGDRSSNIPFFYALTAFGKDFIGINRYVSSRLEDITPEQQTIVTCIAMAYFYGHKPMLAQLFAGYLGYPENRPLRLEKILGEPVLDLLFQVADGEWRPIHQLVAEEILKIVLSGETEDLRSWKRFLPGWALEFIRIVGQSTSVRTDSLTELVRRIFILRDEADLLGTEGADSRYFSRLIDHVESDEGRLSILLAIVRAFPEEAHFWGHLGRFYSIGLAEPEKAIEALDKAIQLSERDPVLYHMKGMAYRKMVDNLLRDIRRQNIGSDKASGILQEPVSRALEAFTNARELDPDSEHPYVSPIQLLLRVLDMSYTIAGYSTRAEFLSTRSKAGTWHRELLDEAENLMSSLQRIAGSERPSRYVLDCQAKLDQAYDDYSHAIQTWHNLLQQRDVYRPPVRRQIARAYLARKNRDWSLLSYDEVIRIQDLMEQNLREEPASDYNIRLWFKAMRYSGRENIDMALDRLSSWRATGDSVEAYYYLYILHVLKAMQGSTMERQKARTLIEECSSRTRNKRDRTFSHEWYGTGRGLGVLVNSQELGEWDDAVGFYHDTQELARIEGRVTKINAPESGYLEVASCGLEAFFVPARVQLLKGRDENRRVTFFLGFSYDGLRAWSVETA